MIDKGGGDARKCNRFAGDLCGSVYFSPVEKAHAGDGNNTFQTATKLTAKKAVERIFDSSCDYDWYV